MKENIGIATPIYTQPKPVINYTNADLKRFQFKLMLLKIRK